MTNMNQNGRSMIEMLGVLAIIGVLSVGGIAGYSKAMLKYKTNKLIDGVTMLTTNIRTLYAQQKKFTGVDAAAGTAATDLINLGVVPDEMIKTGNILKNPFAGTIVVDLDNSVPGKAGEDRAFIIGVNGIPKEACMAIATSDWGSNYSSGLIGMAVSKASTTNNTAADKLVTTISETAGEAGKIFAGTCLKLVSDGYAAYCAKDLPIPVSEASAACNCSGSECSVAIKYY